MILHKAPENWPIQQYIKENKETIFLAGSIEMGAAENWQDKIAESFKDLDVVLLNPRRDDWDSSWKQTIEDENFSQQVNWELNSLEQCTMILMYFDPNTKSPISLLELGYFARTGKMIVICPDGFWRKGNVDIVCKRSDIKQLNSIDEFIKMYREWYKELHQPG